MVQKRQIFGPTKIHGEKTGQEKFYAYKIRHPKLYLSLIQLFPPKPDRRPLPAKNPFFQFSGKSKKPVFPVKKPVSGLAHIFPG